MFTFVIPICFGLVRTGTAGGNNVPTCFLLAGKRVKSGYTEKFLYQGGGEKGYTIQMTEKAYRTEEAWMAISPKLVED